MAVAVWTMPTGVTTLTKRQLRLCEGWAIWKADCSGDDWRASNPCPDGLKGATGTCVVLHADGSMTAIQTEADLDDHSWESRPNADFLAWIRVSQALDELQRRTCNRTQVEVSQWLRRTFIDCLRAPKPEGLAVFLEIL